ncbi:hypothetical protein U1Q18_001644 [Sarracenia purpurea var. burkii]
MTMPFLSSDLGDPNRPDVCGSNSRRHRTVMFTAIGGAPLTAQDEQSHGSECRLVIHDHCGGVTMAVAGQASNECRGVPSPVLEWGGITGEDGIGVKV